ncbi:tubulin-folding cofactor B-like [Anopheles darlingi]|uniref:tubulin-folding cofactor B-like n=1 Tax=Anopheles darlingi TaxID=43151 RepID=UPI0021002109|nr:tubulin-folding cofactor B-like [Anopheles darlingi]XP_049548685.1 tubulin-folding cofactor B-like [Anopheles darlingi]
MDEIVRLNISNSHNDAVSFEQKFNRTISIPELKSKLQMLTGTSAAGMALELYRDNKLLNTIVDSDEHPTLADYPVRDGMRIHVTGCCLWQTDAPVPKFELSQEEYDGRRDSLRSFLKQNRLGKYSEESLAKSEAPGTEETDSKMKLAAVGARCRVQTKFVPPRLGEIMYAGRLPGKCGYFVGVKFDEPVGVNDGSVDGKRYFQCAPKYGSFVALEAVEVGDFPALACPLDDEL